VTDKERFSVTVTMTKALKGQGLVYCYGVDDEGWEVVWTDLPWHWEQMAEYAVKGEQVIVWGHEIIAYARVYGAWSDNAGRPERQA